ncbi:MAG: chromosome segregation protein SMC [Stappiaceae bacterium]
MKFQKLRLLGFKSFVEPSEFLIENGLTGVVGPNGCGKSNLVEALRWVMGENSYKNMRASGMDDVIFAGSHNRPGRNTAEVTLFLDNSERSAPAGFNDADVLEVTRRIERESGSAYKINSRDVRARDVQLLFADASTGARSPAMVRQGQIGELISAKPTARRKILEEAAGISGLHARRHEAELRLKGAESNLERLEDVLIQIDGQLENLKKQARQANRYRNISSDIRKTEAMILYLRSEEAREALDETQEQFKVAEAAVNAAAQGQAETAKMQAIAAHQLPQLRDDAGTANAVLQRLKIAQNELESEDRRIRERLQDLQHRLTQLSQDLEREQGMISENTGLLSELEEEQLTLQAESEEAEARASGLSDAVESAQDDLHDSEQHLETITQAQATATARRVQLDRAEQEGRVRIERLEKHLAAVSADLSQITAQIDQAEGVSDKRENVEVAEETLLEAEAAVQTCEETTAQARELERDARGPLIDVERLLSEYETEARTLEQVLGNGQEGAGIPVLDSIVVAKGYEAALGAALGEDLDAPLDDTVPVHWRAPGDGENDARLPDGAEPLSNRVDAPNELARRLAQIGIVSRLDGPTYQKLLMPGQRLVSIEGDLWRWDGLVVGAEAPTPAAQRLAQRNRLIELEDQIATAQNEVSEKRGHLETSQSAVSLAAEAEQQARQTVKQAQAGVVAARELLVQAEKALGQLGARQTAQRDAKERAEVDYSDAVEGLQEIAEALAEIHDVQDKAGEIEQLRAQVSLHRGALAEARAAAETIEREKQMRLRRLEAIERERRSWRDRAMGAQKQIDVLQERHNSTEDEIATLMEMPDELEAKRRDLLSEVAKAEEGYKAAQDALVIGEKKLEDVDREAKGALEALAATRENKIRAEERHQSALARRNEINERIAESLNCAPAALREIAGIKEGAVLPDAEATEKRLDRLKAERDRMGGVNLRAEEEVRELTEQREMLVSERDDLFAAIRKLRNGISGLNREARERLLVAFDMVNAEFQRLFTHLFGGGTAELKLVDSDDPLEAGLEIMARPPGKKPQTMTLLSGGEQALTCMALIFAVFLTNPAPICVLDEVDAPLDDANVERYCDLLDEMVRSTDTRFVVITHNPITMARMSRLFGVTMAERGVSQLVSVDLETAEQFREAV